ncbi:Hypothetical protein HVR_LOCUS232 [uncultured virus]|nr:Hypothetical protein HVR_LOCUS232 [uncultured virus]
MISDDMSLDEINGNYQLYLKHAIQRSWILAEIVDLKHVCVEQEVDQYQIYLILSWLLIEVIFIKLKLNISGYTQACIQAKPGSSRDLRSQAQMKIMHKYQRYTTELSMNKHFGVKNLTDFELEIVDLG